MPTCGEERGEGTQVVAAPVDEDGIRNEQQLLEVLRETLKRREAAAQEERLVITRAERVSGNNEQEIP